MPCPGVFFRRKKQLCREKEIYRLGDGRLLVGMLLRRGIRLGGHWRLALPRRGRIAGARSEDVVSSSLGEVDGHAILLRDSRPKLVMTLVERVDTGLGTARAANARGAAVVHLAHAVGGK